MMKEENETLAEVNNFITIDNDTEKTPQLQFSYEPPKVEEPLFARIISVILHPLFMGIYGVAILFLYTDFNFLFAGQFLLFMLPVIFLTCIIPASSLYFFNRSGLAKSSDVKGNKSGSMSYLLFFFSYSLLLYYFASAGLYTWFLGILATPIVLIIIGAINCKSWNASLHMMGIGALIGTTLSVCYNVKGLNPFILFIILFILAGCLGVSRLMLQKETPAQVYISFLIGLVVSYICVWIGTYWAFIMFFFKRVLF